MGPAAEEPANETLGIPAVAPVRPRRGSSPGARNIGVVTNSQASEHLGKRPKLPNAEVVKKLVVASVPDGSSAIDTIPSVSIYLLCVFSLFGLSTEATLTQPA